MTSSSSSIGTFYGLPNNGRHSRIILIAKYCDLQLEVKETSVYKGDHLTKEYLSLFPYGKVPGFKSSNGQFTLIENRAIARYIANLAKGYNLLGKDDESIGLIEQWIDFVDEELFKIGVKFHQQMASSSTQKEEEIEKIKKELQRAMNFLELNLKNKKQFLVGSQITLADLTMTSCLYRMFTKILGPNERSKYPNILHYYQQISEIPKIFHLFKGDGEFLKEDR